MNIDELEAGREMDALVAERVMGWTWKKLMADGVFLEDIEYYDGDTFMCYGHSWEPSTDIAAAWQVVEKVQDRLRVIGPKGGRDEVIINLHRYGVDGHYMFAFMKKPHHKLYVIGSSPALPLAICRAALKAVQGQP